MKILLLFCICILFSTITNAQNEAGLPHLENLLQSTYINPSNSPDHKVSIGLPGISSISAGITNTGFSFNELATKKSEGVYSIRPWNEVLNNLKKANYLYSGASVDLFSLGVKVRHYYFTFNITEKATARFSYPKDLISLAVNGNEPFFGKDANLKSLGLDITHRREFAIGARRDFKKFSLGARLKYIQGLSNISTKSQNLSLYTDQDFYGMIVKADATLNTSGIPGESDPELEFEKYINHTKNFGAGIDLGGSYKVSKKIVVSAAINNLGFIRWNNMTYNYNIKGGSTFEGADLGRPLLDQLKNEDDSFEEEGDVLLDSLKGSLQYSETSNAYSTFLIPQLFLSGKYLITPTTQALASVIVEKHVRVRPAFTLGVQQQLGKVLNAVLTYTVQYGRFDNFGIGFVVKPPVIPMQFYLVGDNILTTYSIINNSYIAPLNDRTFNLRLGINLVFGYIRKQDKLYYPSTK